MVNILQNDHHNTIHFNENKLFSEDVLYGSEPGMTNLQIS